MRILKIVFSTVLLLAFITAVALTCLIYFFDINKFKPTIIEEVKKQTGYQLVIDGNLSWSLYPHLGIKIDRMTLQAPQELSPFIELQNTKIATDVMELLKGREKLRGNINIEAIRYLNLHAKDAQALLHWENNVLTIDNIRAKLYQGSVEGLAHGRDLMTAKPRWDFNLQFNQIQMEDFLQDLNGPNAKVKMRGTAMIKVQGETAGATKVALYQNLNGNADVQIFNGDIFGIDFNYLVQTADALLNKKTISPVSMNQTTFNQFSAKAKIKNGIAATNMFLISSSFMMNGEGNIDLNRQSLQLELQIKPQLTKHEWKIPVLVSGSMDNPDVRLDTTGIEKMLAKEEIEKVKEKANEIIQKNVPGKAGQFLQNLIGK